MLNRFVKLNIMKKIIPVITTLLLSLTLSAQVINHPYNPRADEDAIVTFGNARFTVLTSRLIRLEWSENGIFEDNATLGVVNRNLPVPKFTVKITGRTLTIKTEYLTLNYKGNEKFSDDNTSVFFMMNGKKAKWTPDMPQTGNLLGTTRTLDGFKGTKTREPYDMGVASRDGWAVIDESSRHLIINDDSDWQQWVAPREQANTQDLYLFVYGHDYKAAVSDFIKIGGNIPLPPKYMFGYWWSRYWMYTDNEFIDLAKEIKSYDIPIDVMIIDMDWHETWLHDKEYLRDTFGMLIGWTGYTWQKDLFPNPENFLHELHDLNLKTALNLHPASGVRTFEDCYDRFIKDYTSRTDNYDGPKGFIDENGNKCSVRFRISDRDWADAYFNSVIHPLQDMGVDFWWLDWQQYSYCYYMKGLSNTFWLNHTFFNDKVRQNTTGQGKKAPRPVIYHRWGGIGSHRYQVGFSGDTYDNWEVLAYLPYFTSTASNVGYGYWGHDIGGHCQATEHPTNPEMFTRWLQYGVFTPIFKTHSTKSSYIERRIWRFPDYFETMHDAIRLRYTLSPYIYNAARQTFDTGISMCRPMYYDYPENEEAYTFKEQNMFGDDIISVVLCQPADSSTNLTERIVWFPTGDNWYDMATGMMYEGGTIDTLHYTINENPYYVKAGSIIPMASKEIRNLQETSNEICLVVIPGNGSSEMTLYDDDGISQLYDSDFTTTKVVKHSDSNCLTMNIYPREGHYDGMDANRHVKVVVEGKFAPEKITVNGKDYPYSRFAEDNTWTYDGKDMATVICLPETSASQQIDIKCQYDAEKTKYQEIIYGKKGIIKRMSELCNEFKLLYLSNISSMSIPPLEYMRIVQTSSYITEDPQNAVKYLEDIDIESMKDALERLEIPQTFKDRVIAQSEL